MVAVDQVLVKLVDSVTQVGGCCAWMAAGRLLARLLIACLHVETVRQQSDLPFKLVAGWLGAPLHLLHPQMASLAASLPAFLPRLHVLLISNLHLQSMSATGASWCVFL